MDDLAAADRELDDEIIDRQQGPTVRTKVGGAGAGHQWSLPSSWTGAAGTGEAPRSGWMHRTVWVGDSSGSSIGICSSQSSVRYSQRGANRQPGGGSIMFGGRPTMAVSGVWLGRSARGIDASSAARVRMFDLGEELLGRRLFDEGSGVHDGHLVGVAGNDAEVVGDQDHRHPRVAPQPIEQVEDLALDGHVERGRGLVGDEQSG